MMDNWISPLKAEPDVYSVSLGMVVIDEIRFPSRSPIFDVAGGSATYGTRTPTCLSTPCYVLVH